MSKYRLIFRGKLKDGTDRALCIEKLARMFGQDRDTVEQRLFGSRKVVVQHTDSEERAREFIEAFEKAGALLNIETEGLDFPIADSSPDVTRTRKRPSLRPAGEYVPRPTKSQPDHPLDDQATRQRNAVPETDDRKPAPKSRHRRRRR
jgi:hypothetical protein